MTSLVDVILTAVLVEVILMAVLIDVILMTSGPGGGARWAVRFESWPRRRECSPTRP
ncbi:MAG: hypothetical protein AAFP84_00785 [Actinomycetota bacterium]